MALNYTIDLKENEMFLLEQTRIGLNLLPKDYNLGLVIDLGAHAGAFSLNAILYGAKKVVAIEPHPANYTRLISNITRNNLWGRIIPLPLAVGGRANKPFDILHLSSIGVNSGQHSLKFIGAGEAVVDVPVVPLRWLIKNLDIDYLKIDIEGGEWQIFEDLDKSLLAGVRFIDIEVHSLDNKDFFGTAKHPIEDKLFPWLEECGFVNMVTNGDFRGMRKTE